MGWKRPRDLLACAAGSGVGAPTEPTMLPTEPMDLVQDVTTDCSVVASLCTGVSLRGRDYSKVTPHIIHSKHWDHLELMSTNTNPLVNSFNTDVSV